MILLPHANSRIAPNTDYGHMPPNITAIHYIATILPLKAVYFDTVVASYNTSDEKAFKRLRNQKRLGSIRGCSSSNIIMITKEWKLHPRKLHVSVIPSNRVYYRH